jgi:CheY-like chemotaxis protein
MVIERMGLDPTLVADGESAVREFEAAQKTSCPFALLIFDLTIVGGMGGKQAISAIRRLDPHVPAIVSSGYSSDPVMANYQLHGFQAAVAKPFDVTTLADAIRRFVPQAQPVCADRVPQGQFTAAGTMVSVRVEVVPSGLVTWIVRVSVPSSFFLAETTRPEVFPLGPVSVSVLVVVPFSWVTEPDVVAVLPSGPVKVPAEVRPVSVLVAVPAKVLVLPLNLVRLPTVVTVPSAFFLVALVVVAVLPAGPVVVRVVVPVPVFLSQVRSASVVTVWPSWLVTEVSREALPFSRVVVLSMVPDLPLLVE